MLPADSIADRQHIRADAGTDAGTDASTDASADLSTAAAPPVTLPTRQSRLSQCHRVRRLARL